MIFGGFALWDWEQISKQETEHLMQMFSGGNAWRVLANNKRFSGTNIINN